MSIQFNFTDITTTIPARRFEKIAEPGFLGWYAANHSLAGDATGGFIRIQWSLPDVLMRGWSWRFHTMMGSDSVGSARAASFEVRVTLQPGGFPFIFGYGGQLNGPAGIPTSGFLPGNFPGSFHPSMMPPFWRPRGVTVFLETSNVGAGDTVTMSCWLKKYDPRE